MTELEKATWEFLFNTPSISLLKHGSPYSDFVEAVTSDREKAFIAGAEWQRKQDQSVIETAEDHAYFAGSEAMREKLSKLKELADKMYYAAQYLTTDASKLRKAMHDYWHYVVYELKEDKQ